MSPKLVYLYRSPNGLIASETQIDGAPLVGDFQRQGEHWRAVGLGRLLRRWNLDAEIERVPTAILLAAADRLGDRNA
jgi:hypothetical protein